MSIVDSTTERIEAEAKIASATPEQLTRDLEFWTVAGHQQSHEFSDLQDKMNIARALYQEAQTWVALIADELVKRRNERNGS